MYAHMEVDVLMGRYFPNRARMHGLADGGVVATGVDCFPCRIAQGPKDTGSVSQQR